MNTIRRTIDLDAATDARLRALAAERGQDEAAVLAEAIALLDSVVEIDAPDVAEDRLRLERFKRHAGRLRGLTFLSRISLRSCGLLGVLPV